MERDWSFTLNWKFLLELCESLHELYVMLGKKNTGRCVFLYIAHKKTPS